jgi:hypothetical protein
LIDFVNNLKKGGLYVLATVLPGTWDDMVCYHSCITKEHSHSCEKLEECLIQKKALDAYIKASCIKAFGEVVMAPSVREGVQSLVLVRTNSENGPASKFPILFLFSNFISIVVGTRSYETQHSDSWLL